MKELRACIIAVVLIAAVLSAAPLASAGQNGGWGKGKSGLSETVLFYVGTAEEPAGYLYWNPELAEFKYDFHGYYLDAGTMYYLICYEGEPGDEPTGFLELGWCPACSDGEGVHIKGEMAWPGLEDATICLVPESYVGFGGTDPWSPDEYQIADTVLDL